MDLAVLQQLRADPLGDVRPARRSRRPGSRRWSELIAVLMPMTSPLQVHERPAAVAGIDRRVGLQELLVLRHADAAALGADDAGRHGVLPGRTAGRAASTQSPICSSSLSPSVATGSEPVALIRTTARSVFGSVCHVGRFELAAVVQLDRDLAAAGDDVVVRQDDAGRIDDHAASRSFAAGMFGHCRTVLPSGISSKNRLKSGLSSSNSLGNWRADRLPPRSAEPRGHRASPPGLGLVLDRNDRGQHLVGRVAERVGQGVGVLDGRTGGNQAAGIRSQNAPRAQRRSRRRQSPAIRARAAAVKGLRIVRSNNLIVCLRKVGCGRDSSR